MLNSGPDGINAESDGVIGVGFVLVVVASSNREFVVSDMDDAVCSAVGGWRKGGGIGGAGAGEIRERAAAESDIRFDEVG